MPLAYSLRPLRPSLTHLSGFAVALSLGLNAPDGRAEAPKAEGYTFVWTRLPGGEACIGARELSVNVEKALGRPAFVSASKADRGIEGSVAPRPGGGWAASLQLSDARGSILGTRELTSDSPDCRALDESLTLSITLLMDPDASPTMMPGGWVERGGKPKAPAERKPADSQAPAAAEPGEKAGAKPGESAGAKPTGEAGAPKGGAATAPAAGTKKPERRDRFEIGAHGGYVTGDSIFPVRGGSGDGLGLGAGVRAGYALRSGLWIGASYTYFQGGEFNAVETDRVSYPGLSGDPYGMGMDGSFLAHVVGAEVGYTFSLGPFEARPYLGVGAGVFDFTRHYSLVPSVGNGPPSTQLSPSSLNEGSPLIRFATWPGFALHLPLGESFFVGADARWPIVFGAPAMNNVGLFATAGWRF
jgi:hypothetical protein